jgi:hypothetical protein
MWLGFGGIAGPIVNPPASLGIGLHPCRAVMVLARPDTLSAATSNTPIVLCIVKYEIKHLEFCLLRIQVLTRIMRGQKTIVKTDLLS